MSEITTSIIQMNCHEVLSKTAETMRVCSILSIIIGLAVLFLATWHESNALELICVIVIIISVILLRLSFDIPKDRIIQACANGPVSIEQLETRYDIIKIDGKLLTLRIKE